MSTSSVWSCTTDDDGGGGIADDVAGWGDVGLDIIVSSFFLVLIRKYVHTVGTIGAEGQNAFIVVISGRSRLWME